MSEMTTEHISKDDSSGIREISAKRGLAVSDSLIRYIAIVALFIVFSITAKNFFTMRSVLSLALQTSAITIMGIGVTFAIITGGIDLSIGSVVALSGTIAVMAANCRSPNLAQHDHRLAGRSRLWSP